MLGTSAPAKCSRGTPPTWLAASTGGLPVSAVTGIRFALEPGAESEAVPVRSAILGATLAVVVIIATVVFGSSLNSFVSHPRLYGWNWNYALIGGGGAGDIPAAQAATLLDHDPSVANWSGYWFGNLQIDGLTVPVLGGSPGASVAPPILTGHGFDRPGQIVLGPGTLTQIHKSVGDTVTVRYGTTTPHLLRIVGTATMPAVGVAGVTGHASMGTGAVVPYQLLPASVRNQFNQSPAGPNAEFVRLKPGADAKTALRSLNRIAAEVSTPENYGNQVYGAQQPAEIVNYRSMGATPLILGLGLTAGAVTALGLTFVASVRRRRRAMAMLRTLGFTGRQLRASVAWQSSVAVVSGSSSGCRSGSSLGASCGISSPPTSTSCPARWCPLWRSWPSRSVRWCSATWSLPFRDASRPVRPRRCCGPSKNARHKATAMDRMTDRGDAPENFRDAAYRSSMSTTVT